MQEHTCIVVGGGYAGIHTIKALLKSFPGKFQGKKLRLILMDKEAYHLRKVLLFKPAAGGENITIPLADMFPEGVQFVQGAIDKVDGQANQLYYTGSDGKANCIKYDQLVLTVGSVVRQPDTEQGGIALTGLDSAARIRACWQANLRKASHCQNEAEREQLLTVAVAGAGISGIEASAELISALRDEARKLNLNPSDVRVYLLNAQERLFQEGPAKVGHKLAHVLSEAGVIVKHAAKALYEKDGKLVLANGEQLSVGLSVWTLGLLPNPVLRTLGLPITQEGQLIVDASYRVKGVTGVYAIGDCARITDAATGRPDRLTCKEATAQAARLAKVLCADLDGSRAPEHTGFMDFFCIGLGPERGMVWTHKWGLDIILTGKLGWKVRKFTWDQASLLQ
ncbi:NAD(P)/FAD-dependent oxidoreductase [Paenibacillus alba]|uniref:NADH:ubiquinone reductase (non-electrogenic) n=1 Tax=Paenibacillus alba TaxID=1197127 RepID=A0ABU6G787_9BACL|nr:FAD-dependent oxidoreductase [Paenibacillus alba]MEC0230047.1 FAD-dependent oxidoreductase [Paenibacillus alba]